MKRVFTIIAIMLMLSFTVSALASCDAVDKITEGGKDLVASVQYDYVIITMPDGTAKEIELDSWWNASGGNSAQSFFYIFGADGDGYVTGARNCMFINKPDVDINVSALSSLGNLNYTYESVTIKNPDGTLLELLGGDRNNAALQMMKFEAEDGTLYSPHPDNVWVKLKVD